MVRSAVALVVPGCMIALAACDLTDPATRLAYDLQSGAARLGAADGATITIAHAFPSKAGECTGPYKVQLDAVGALIIWCRDDAGSTVSSHSTSYAARFVTTPQTYIVDKPARAALQVDVQRRQGRAVVTGVR